MPVRALSGTIATSGRAPVAGRLRGCERPRAADDAGQLGAGHRGEVTGQDEHRVRPGLLRPCPRLRQPLVEPAAALRDAVRAEPLGKLERLGIRRDDGHRDDAGGLQRGGHGARQEPHHEGPPLLGVESLAEASLGALQAPDRDEGDDVVEGEGQVTHGAIVDEAAVRYRTARHDEPPGAAPAALADVPRPLDGAPRDRRSADPHRSPRLRAAAHPAPRGEPPGPGASPGSRRGAHLPPPRRPPPHPLAPPDRP